MEPSVKVAPSQAEAVQAVRVSSFAEAFQATAERFADEVALRTPDGAVEVTFREYAERVRRIASGLSARGLKRGNTIALLMVNRPFHVGDYIQAAGIGGTVKSMNLLSTTLHSPDNCQIVVPNGKILADPIINYSALPSRRLDLVVGIAYEDDVGAAMAAVREVLASDSRVLEQPAPVVALLELGDSSVNLAVRPWVPSSEYWPARFDLLRGIKARFDADGITIPFPQREITIRSNGAPPVPESGTPKRN